jgi:hypothetical protein
LQLPLLSNVGDHPYIPVGYCSRALNTKSQHGLHGISEWNCAKLQTQARACPHFAKVRPEPLYLVFAALSASMSLAHVLLHLAPLTDSQKWLLEIAALAAAMQVIANV